MAAFILDELNLSLLLFHKATAMSEQSLLNPCKLSAWPSSSWSNCSSAIAAAFTSPVLFLYMLFFEKKQTGYFAFWKEMWQVASIYDPQRPKAKVEGRQHFQPQKLWREINKFKVDQERCAYLLNSWYLFYLQTRYKAILLQLGVHITVAPHCPAQCMRRQEHPLASDVMLLHCKDKLLHHLLLHNSDELPSENITHIFLPLFWVIWHAYLRFQHHT